jgi:hypothetical protein
MVSSVSVTVVGAAHDPRRPSCVDELPDVDSLAALNGHLGQFLVFDRHILILPTE